MIHIFSVRNRVKTRVIEALIEFTVNSCETALQAQYCITILITLICDLKIIQMKNLRFGQLCTDDKLRLQALINELANANQNLKAKEKRIDELELQLNEKENLVNEVNSQKSGFLFISFVRLSVFLTKLYIFTEEV